MSSIKSRIQKLEASTGGYHVASPISLDQDGQAFETAPDNEDICSLEYSLEKQRVRVARNVGEDYWSFVRRSSSMVREEFGTGTVLLRPDIHLY